MQSLLVVLDPGPATGEPLAPRIAARVASERPDLRVARSESDPSELLSELAGVSAVIFLDARDGDGPASVAVEMLRGGVEPGSPALNATPGAWLRQAVALGVSPLRAASVTLVGGPGRAEPPGGAGDDDAVALAARCVLRLLEEWELELA